MATSTDHKNDIRRIFDQAAATFDSSEIDFFTPLGAALVAFAGVASGERVLDVGCGRGSSLFPARRAVGPAGYVAGIDLSTAMVTATRAEATARRLTGIDTYVMDAEAPDFPPGSFDVVLAGFSVMHLPGAPGSLAAYPPLLRAGGRLCFSELVDTDGLPGVVPSSIFTLLEPHFPVERPDPRERGRDPWTRTQAGIERGLIECGFGAVGISEQPFPVRVPSGEAWNRWSLSTGLRAVWDNLTPGPRDRLWGEVADAVDALAGKDGTLELEVRVRFVTARLAR